MRDAFLPRRLRRPAAGFAAVIMGALGVAACGGSAPPTTYDLTAPRQPVRGGVVSGQLIVVEPVAIQVLEQDRIVVKDASGAITFLGGAQWADRLPRLIQSRMIQTFENASRIRAVARPGDRTTPDFQLNSEIRSFAVLADTNEAFVEISAKLVSERTGKIVNARVFSARVPVGAIDAANAARGLDQALSAVLLDIVRFVGGGGRPPVTVTSAR
jgi:cholesterol transport system auxiliary component